LLLITFFLVPLQTSAEELVFRGYFLQGFALLFRSRLVAVIISGLFFGVIHLWNPEALEMGVYTALAYYMGFGIFLGLLTVIDNGIEIPLGIHAVHNMYIACVVTYPDPALQTEALYTITEVDYSLILYTSLVFVVLSSIAFHFKYSWSKESYMRLLSFGRIEKCYEEEA